MLDRQIAQGTRNLAMLSEDRLPGVVAQARVWEAERVDLTRELARLDAVPELQADYAWHVAGAQEQVRHLEETICTAPSNAVRDALAGLVERATLFF